MRAIVLGAALLLTAAGCDRGSGSAAGSSVDTRAVTVRTARPAHHDVARRIALPATLRAESEVTLVAKVTGYLKSISKDRGDRVKAGELIAVLEIPEMASEIAHARAAFAIEGSTCKRLEAIRKAEKSAVTDQDLDLAHAKRDMAEATLRKLETMQEYLQIHAPFDGTVTDRYVDPGAFIQQSRIVSVVDTSKVRVLVDIPESETRFARTGTPAEIRIDALPGRTLRAAVSRSSAALDPMLRTRKVELDLPNADLSLLPGMFARVELLVENHPNALVIPRKAVTVLPNETFVFVERGGQARKCAVKIGQVDGDWTEACSGVSGDDVIILPEGRTLTDGMPVTPTGL